MNGPIQIVDTDSSSVRRPLSRRAERTSMWREIVTTPTQPTGPRVDDVIAIDLDLLDVTAAVPSPTDAEPITTRPTPE